MLSLTNQSSVGNTAAISEPPFVHCSGRLINIKEFITAISCAPSLFLPCVQLPPFALISLCSFKRRNYMCSPIRRLAEFLVHVLFTTEYASDGPIQVFDYARRQLHSRASDWDSAGPGLGWTVFKACANWPMSARRPRRARRLCSTLTDLRLQLGDGRHRPRQ